jgi:hypothetical protein
MQIQGSVDTWRALETKLRHFGRRQSLSGISGYTSFNQNKHLYTDALSLPFLAPISGSQSHPHVETLLSHHLQKTSNERALGEPEPNVEHTGSRNNVRSRPNIAIVEQVSRVVHKHLSQNVQTKQVDQRLVSRRNRLRKRSGNRKRGEHLEQVVVRRVQTQRQALEVGDLGSGLVVVTALLVARCDAGG